MTTAARTLQIRGTLETAFADVLTPTAIAALEALRDVGDENALYVLMPMRV